MRYATSLFATLIILGLTGGAYGADQSAIKEMSRLADKVQGKIISKTDAAVKVEAHDCWLHIEFADSNVAFDLPMQGTQLTETDLEDGIVVQNHYMTRTVTGREPEVFERLLLKFGRHNSGELRQSFERAIKACGSQHTRVAGMPRT